MLTLFVIVHLPRKINPLAAHSLLCALGFPRFYLSWPLRVCVEPQASVSPPRRSPSSFFLPHPIYYLRHSFSLSLLVVTQIRGHTAGSSPFLPTTYGSCLASFIARRFSSFFPRRLASTRAYPRYQNRRSQQLILYLRKKETKSHHGGVRTHGPTISIVS